MLYNASWAKTQEPFTLENLVEWLKTKTGYYCFSDADHCLVAQWAQSVDPSAYCCYGQGHSFGYMVHGEVVDMRPFRPVATGVSFFSEALMRAEALLRAKQREMEKENAKQSELEPA